MAFKLNGWSAFTKITDEEKEAGVDRKYKRLQDKKENVLERAVKKHKKAVLKNKPGKLKKVGKLYTKVADLSEKAYLHRQKNIERKKEKEEKKIKRLYGEPGNQTKRQKKRDDEFLKEQREEAVD